MATLSNRSLLRVLLASAAVSGTTGNVWMPPSINLEPYPTGCGRFKSAARKAARGKKK